MPNKKVIGVNNRINHLKFLYKWFMSRIKKALDKELGRVKSRQQKVVDKVAKGQQLIKELDDEKLEISTMINTIGE